MFGVKDIDGSSFQNGTINWKLNIAFSLVLVATTHLCYYAPFLLDLIICCMPNPGFEHAFCW